MEKSTLADSWMIGMLEVLLETILVVTLESTLAEMQSLALALVLVGASVYSTRNTTTKARVG